MRREKKGGKARAVKGSVFAFEKQRLRAENQEMKEELAKVTTQLPQQANLVLRTPGDLV